ncbi:MAG: HAD-IIB family hydrolase, partial [Clostridia bacterium]|nr:HAD-IIB family hydrolase [Clostridia bacterium]
MNDYRLIAVDIDGTLLSSQSVLTERTKFAVRRLIDRGMIFVLSTGRPYQGIRKFVDALNLNDMPYILYNGAMVMAGGKVIYSLTMPAAVAREIADEGHKSNSTMICWSDNRLYAEKDCDKVAFYKSISGVEPIFIDDLGTLADQGITKFVWYDDVDSTNRNFARLTAEMGDRVNVHPSR